MSCLRFIAVPVCRTSDGKECLLPGLSKANSDPIGPSPRPGRRIHYFINQGIGRDVASKGTHFADARLNGRRYSAAVDIGVSSNPFGPPEGNESQQLEILLKALRACGLASWHRRYQGSPDDENEIHIIDPRVPYMKPRLYNQLYGRKGYYKRGEGGGYPRGTAITSSNKRAFETLRQQKIKGKVVVLSRL